MPALHVSHPPGGLAGLGLTLRELGSLGYKIVADPQTALLAAYTAWKQVYRQLADGFGASPAAQPDSDPTEKDMLAVIGIDKLLAIERATVETGKE
jgi:2-methylisocitrate lyase-like PEP mutase family enzyme